MHTVLHRWAFVRRHFGWLPVGLLAAGLLLGWLANLPPGEPFIYSLWLIYTRVSSLLVALAGGTLAYGIILGMPHSMNWIIARAQTGHDDRRDAARMRLLLAMVIAGFISFGRFRQNTSPALELDRLTSGAQVYVLVQRTRSFHETVFALYACDRSLVMCRARLTQRADASAGWTERIRLAGGDVEGEIRVMNAARVVYQGR